MRNITLTLMALCSVSLCFGWGQKGHDTIAYIAEQHLTETTKHAVDSIFDGKSMVYWSNWLDNASHTDDYRYTSTWHYKNIDAGVPYDEAPVNANGNIIIAINDQIGKLGSDTLTLDQAALAMKILVHLVGDLHQPMHMGHLSDRGGNATKVIYFNHDNNLHSIWDSSIVESGHKWSYSEWQDQIDRVSSECEAEIISGDIDDWGRETFAITNLIYEQTPSNENLSYDYVAKWTPVIEDQFLKGGLRLAHVLNSIFDSNYCTEAR